MYCLPLVTNIYVFAADNIQTKYIDAEEIG